MHNDWIVPDWPAPVNVRAVSTTCAGGVSSGVYASLNLGAHVGDDPAAVAENRRRLRVALNLVHEPRWLKQVHGAQVIPLNVSIKDGANPSPSGEAWMCPRERTRVLTLSPLRGEGRVRGEQFIPPSPPPSPASGRGDEYWQLASNRQSANFLPSRRGLFSDTVITETGDAAVAHSFGDICVILTADCLPVLFCDRAGKTVAATHAGWRGLAAGVLEATVAAMRSAPGEMLAWLGPAIGPEAYEVGEEVRTSLVKEHPEADQAFEPAGPGKWLCDLYLLASQRLRRTGVTHIYGGGFCTFSERERFFSYRRDGECGRMATLIWLV